MHMRYADLKIVDPKPLQVSSISIITCKGVKAPSIQLELAETSIAAEGIYEAKGR
jgi:hypothetical protein